MYLGHNMCPYMTYLPGYHNVPADQNYRVLLHSTNAFYSVTQVRPATDRRRGMIPGI